MKPAPPVTSPVLLGIEGGGTRTTVRLVDGTGSTLKAFQAQPAVLSLMTDRELRWHLRDIAGRLPLKPEAIGIGLAGARTAADQERLRRATVRVWPGIPCVATNDLETALAAAPAPTQEIPRVLVLSGTGSCCFGRTPDGRTAKVGGRGHIIGDRGSACDIGLRALRAVMADLDHRGRMGPLGAAMLNALMFNDPDQLIPWSVHAPKTEIAQLAITVFAVAEQKDALAKKILSDSAAMLAEDACACASQLMEVGGPMEFILNGGVMLRNPGFMKDVTRRIRACWPKAQVSPLKGPSVFGAVNLARAAFSNASPAPRRVTREIKVTSSSLELPASIADLAVLKESPTEKRNPRSMKLDRLGIVKGIELMLSEDALIPDAILKEKRAISQVVAQVVRAFENGGRLFYAGAGTSGRLGVLDASEIPPTFRAPREQVQGIIAGGRQALWSAVEGAEDDAQAGATAMKHRQLGRDDVLLGIAASGRTPFVWGAIHEANERGAFTALLCFNPAIRTATKKIPHDAWKPKVLIIPNVGPEVLTGSTRLKSGTATKLVLNLITTLAMTQVGKVISNLMVDLNPSNVKLRDRALRILAELTGCSQDESRAALQATGWQVKEAYERLK
ncbi:N-acetylmuramic acid 6-phosphate etherase [Prosthecobacter sp. SYSU 5D2]|uniref:N-acetylmuramic acid 6-phosphate etherase n=1 Tax=Prosthecobacter sp. SYSU 5D2 TaxID=3134134 RepID=UPI0031FF0B64